MPRVGPKVTVYISDPKSSAMEFYDEKTGESGNLDFSKTDKFVCFNPSDIEILLNYCGGKKN